MTPTDHTSTLLEILGGSFPTTKHSGGRYLEEENASLVNMNPLQMQLYYPVSRCIFETDMKTYLSFDALVTLIITVI